MSSKKKGFITVSGEWAKHLRRWGRRQFWRRERTAERLFVRDRVNELNMKENESVRRIGD